MTQTLDNLRSAGVLDVIQYLERVPDKLIPKKGELIDELKKAANFSKNVVMRSVPIRKYRLQIRSNRVNYNITTTHVIFQ